MSARDSSVYVLILAGGGGTRLWPLSNDDRPKQFVSLCGNTQTLLQLTVSRMSNVCGRDAVRIVTSGKWDALLAEQLKPFQLDGHAVIREPEGRNTAPAVALGIAELMRGGAGKNDVVIVSPSDHITRDEGAFERAVADAVRAARQGNLVTFGIVPTRPETGYGYLKTSRTEHRWLKVDAFKEKPDAQTAGLYLQSPTYLWNGGIFCFQIGDMLDAYEKFFPAGADIISASPEEARCHFLACPSISIDHAIMEKARNIACIPLDAGWSDVGSWDSVFQESVRDGDNNAAEGDIAMLDCRNSLIRGHDRQICAVDIDSMLVVDTGDMVLVAPRGSLNKLREIMKKRNEIPS